MNCIQESWQYNNFIFFYWVEAMMYHKIFFTNLKITTGVKILSNNILFHIIIINLYI